MKYNPDRSKIVDSDIRIVFVLRCRFCQTYKFHTFYLISSNIEVLGILHTSCRQTRVFTLDTIYKEQILDRILDFQDRTNIAFSPDQNIEEDDNQHIQSRSKINLLHTHITTSPHYTLFHNYTRYNLTLIHSKKLHPHIPHTYPH
jgi:hypothetical protein